MLLYLKVLISFDIEGHNEIKNAIENFKDNNNKGNSTNDYNNKEGIILRQI